MQHAPRLFELSDYEGEFIRALHEERARFLIVGGRAVRFYRPMRMTHDLDVLVGFDGENLAATMTARGRVDPRFFRQRWAPSHTRPNVHTAVDLRLTHGDVLTSIPGVEFEVAWTQRVIAVSADEREVPIISLEHLIENRRADVARDPKIAADLKLLTE